MEMEGTFPLFYIFNYVFMHLLRVTARQGFQYPKSLLKTVWNVRAQGFFEKGHSKTWLLLLLWWLSLNLWDRTPDWSREETVLCNSLGTSANAGMYLSLCNVGLIGVGKKKVDSLLFCWCWFFKQIGGCFVKMWWQIFRWVELMEWVTSTLPWWPWRLWGCQQTMFLWWELVTMVLNVHRNHKAH